MFVTSSNRRRFPLKGKFTVSFIGICLIVLSLAACNNTEGQNNTENKEMNETDQLGTLEISMPPWVNSPPQAWMVKLIIEEHLGWKVNITEADIGLSFASTANGTTDFFVDAWIPDSHDAFVEEHGDDIELLEPFTEVAPGGLVVPDYVEIGSIEELNEEKEQFGGKIIGIEPGAGIMEITTKAIEEYDLDFELVEGSDFAMTAAIGDAVDNNEWIVVTGWSPHWKFTKFDLKFLDDPQKVYGEIRHIYPVINKGLREKAPEVVDFLDKWEVDISVWDELIHEISVNEEDPETTVRNWLDNHEDLVQTWLE